MIIGHLSTMAQLLGRGCVTMAKIWKFIIGMRNRLIHGYYDIDLDIVWKTVEEEISPLVDELEKLIHFNENGVFQCKCGKIYLSDQKRYILQHIKTCSGFITQLDDHIELIKEFKKKKIKQMKTNRESNNKKKATKPDQKSKQKTLSNFSRLES